MFGYTRQKLGSPVFAASLQADITKSWLHRLGCPAKRSGRLLGLLLFQALSGLHIRLGTFDFYLKSNGQYHSSIIKSLHCAVSTQLNLSCRLCVYAHLSNTQAQHRKYFLTGSGVFAAYH